MRTTFHYVEKGDFDRKEYAARKQASAIVAAARAEATSAFDLGQQVWTRYYEHKNAGLLISAHITKSILRIKYGLPRDFGISHVDLD